MWKTQSVQLLSVYEDPKGLAFALEFCDMTPAFVLFEDDVNAYVESCRESTISD